MYSIASVIYILKTLRIHSMKNPRFWRFPNLSYHSIQFGIILYIFEYSTSACLIAPFKITMHLCATITAMLSVSTMATASEYYMLAYNRNRCGALQSAVQVIRNCGCTNVISSPAVFAVGAIYTGQTAQVYRNSNCDQLGSSFLISSSGCKLIPSAWDRVRSLKIHCWKEGPTTSPVSLWKMSNCKKLQFFVYVLLKLMIYWRWRSIEIGAREDGFTSWSIARPCIS